jgi:hypothetical protein
MDKIVISYIKAGFANQIFQFATGYAASKRIGASLKLDISYFETSKEFTFKLDNLNIPIDIASDKEISKLKNLPNAPLIYRILGKLGVSNPYRKSSHINEKFSFSSDKQIMNLLNSSYIDGWCTSLNYFNSFKEELTQLITPKNPFSFEANYYLDKISSSNSISIHIRRGDYINLEEFFRVMPLTYYREAAAKMLDKLHDVTFFIFSNDLAWARENLTFLSNSVFVDLNYSGSYKGKADIEEFFLMKNCKHNIIANSSFSWWPAYLNENNQKIVITPKVWFNNKMYQESFSKHPLQEESWISI